MQGQISLGKRVFMVFGETADRPPIGTGFSVNRSELVLTANHVVECHSRVLVVNTSGQELQIVPASRIVSHPCVDIAAIFLPAGVWYDAEYFELGIPPSGYPDFPLGEEVASYGYPQMGAEKPIPPRLMKGHIQRKFKYKDNDYIYSSYELGFPAFYGQSGSPIFLDNLTPRARDKVVGVVTKSISFRSETQRDVSEASWAIGASLTPLSDWIEALPTEYP